MLLLFTDWDNAIDCGKHFGPVCLGNIWFAGVTSVFPIWRNGKPMSDVCHSDLYCKFAYMLSFCVQFAVLPLLYWLQLNPCNTTLKCLNVCRWQLGSVVCVGFDQLCSRFGLDGTGIGYQTSWNFLHHLIWRLSIQISALQFWVCRLCQQNNNSYLTVLGGRL